MNEAYLQRIVELEKQARSIYETAVREAERLPVQAESEANALVKQAISEAEAQASQLLAGAHIDEEGARILQQAEQETERMEALAAGRFDRAVSFVLNRITGRE